MTTDIGANIVAVRETIRRACEKVNRDPSEVTLITVTKQQSVADIQQAIHAGERHFGESRVFEAQAKIELFEDKSLHWHLLGDVSVRQARYISRLFDSFHALDDELIADHLSNFVNMGDLPLFPVFVQINISGEATKSGLNAYNWEQDRETLRLLVAKFRRFYHYDGIIIKGLMTLAPYEDDKEIIRPYFRSLAHLRDVLQQETGELLPDLSMGMTNDYAVAIEEGATMVRVGRAIFGERHY